MKRGDLVVATFKAVEPTSWYKQLYNTQEPAVVTTSYHSQDEMVEIYYRGGLRLCAKTNLKVVSSYENR